MALQAAAKDFWDAWGCSFIRVAKQGRAFAATAANHLESGPGTGGGVLPDLVETLSPDLHQRSSQRSGRSWTSTHQFQAVLLPGRDYVVAQRAALHQLFQGPKWPS